MSSLIKRIMPEEDDFFEAIDDLFYEKLRAKYIDLSDEEFIEFFNTIETRDSIYDHSSNLHNKISDLVKKFIDSVPELIKDI